ncbi:MAG: sugar ABC transporter permease [Firmicutes bacterium]|nr:sugar ABC transporter permease [Bacillota bacterium]
MRAKEQAKWAVIFLLPALVVYTGLLVLPAAYALGLSLTDWDGLDKPTYVGLRNFKELIGDPVLWTSLKNNLVYAACTILIGNNIGLVLALLLETGIKGRGLFRGLLYLPAVLSWVVTGFLWRWVYNPVFGLLNTVLKSVGLGSLAQNWLGDSNIAFFSVVAVAIWKGFGFSMVVYSAGLQNISQDLLEAAKIDGATRWQTVRSIVLPLLRPIMAVVTILALIDAFRVMDVFVVMTSNVQSRALQVIATYIYKSGFDYYRMGYAAALSVVLFLIVGVSSVVYFKTLGKSLTE